MGLGGVIGDMIGGVVAAVTSVATIAGLVVLGVHAARRRRLDDARRLAEWAAAQRWQVIPHHDRMWLLLTRQLIPTAVPSGPVVIGEFHGHQVAVLQATTNDVTDSTVDYAVAAARLPIALPPLTLRPRSRIGDVAEAVTGTRLRTGVPALDERYRLRSPDPAAALWLMRSPLGRRLLLVEPVPIVIAPPWIGVCARTTLVPESAATLLPLVVWLAQEFGQAALGSSRKDR